MSLEGDVAGLTVAKQLQNQTNLILKELVHTDAKISFLVYDEHFAKLFKSQATNLTNPYSSEYPSLLFEKVGESHGKHRVCMTMLLLLSAFVLESANAGQPG